MHMATVSQTEVDQAVQSNLEVTGPQLSSEELQKLYIHVGDRDACVNIILSETARYHLSKLLR